MNNAGTDQTILKTTNRWRSLGVAMGGRMLLVALVPLIVVAITVAIALTRSVDDLEAGVVTTKQEMTDNVVAGDLQYQASVLMESIDGYTNERIHDVLGWARSPIIRQAASAGAAEAQRKGLLALTEDELEAQMQQTRALLQDAELNAYLQDLIRQTPAFAEVFFTDLNGFNVAYSNITSDFVQAGEDWWDVAWARGSHVGSVEYDDSAGVFSIEISVRIDDANGRPLGVLKAVLDIQALQELVTEAASQIKEGTVHLLTAEGDLIADSASRNDPALIMTEQGNLLKANWEPVGQVVGQSEGQIGYLLDQQDLSGSAIVVGYAVSAPGSFYGVEGFDGFSWRAMVYQPEEVAFAPLEGLDNVAVRMAGTRTSTLAVLFVVTAVAAAASIAAAVFTSRGIVRPIVRLAQISQRISAGDLEVEVPVEQQNEIGDLEGAFGQMTVQLRQTLHSEQEQREKLERANQEVEQRAATEQAQREALEQANREIEQRASAERAQREHLQATVQKYVDFMGEVARGNLAARVRVDGDGRGPDGDDPLVMLGHNLNDTVASLQEMTAQIRDAAGNLSAAAAEILAATTQQASGASEQSAAISQTTTTIDEVRAISEQTAQRAQGVVDTAQRTAQVSSSGQQAVSETIQGMGLVKEQVESIASGILALSKQTQAIGQIISTVNDIASQSNMLALNASVEAARAGEAGRGFTVVAQEVRSLAEQSKEATEQVKEILSEIQRGVNAAVMATEEGMKMADSGVKLAGEAGLSIQRLGESVTESTQSAMQIAAAAGQQVTGVEQIALAMQNIDQATTQNLASTQQAERAAQDLADLARSLSEVVGRYQL